MVKNMFYVKSILRKIEKKMRNTNKLALKNYII